MAPPGPRRILKDSAVVMIDVRRHGVGRDNLRLILRKVETKHPRRTILTHTGTLRLYSGNRSLRGW